MADTPPQFAGAAQNALAGMDAPPATAAQAPVYQAPPAAAPPTFFGRILQGALNGLAGGLRQGQENVAGAGTPGFHPGGNGLAYAQQLQDQQDAKTAAAQQQKTAQAQQDFENQRATFQQNQQAQMQQVQATQAKLNGIHLEQQIQHADTDAQDQYYKGQQDNLQSILDGGGKEIAHLKVAAGQSMQEVGASYLKDNPNVMHDPNTHITYSRDADGETEVHILSGDPNAQIDASHANSQLKSIGSDRQIAPGTSMSRHDFNRVFSDESAKVADQHHQVQMKTLDANLALRNSLAEENNRALHEKALAMAKDAGDVENVGELAMRGGISENELGKNKPGVQNYLAKTYPNLDQKSIFLTGDEMKRRDLATNAIENVNAISDALKGNEDELMGPVAGRISEMRLKAGTNSGPLGTIHAAIDAYGLAAAGAHGVRSVLTKEQVQDALLNGLKNGPDAFNAAVKTMTNSLNNLKSVGTPKPVDPTKDLKGQPLPQQPAAESQNPSGGTARKVGDVVTLRNGKQARIKAVLPGGKYQVE